MSHGLLRNRKCRTYSPVLTSVYLLEVNNRNNKTRSEICSAHNVQTGHQGDLRKDMSNRSDPFRYKTNGRKNL